MKTYELIAPNNPILFEEAAVVEDITSNETQQLIDDLIHTSIAVGGYGLAAPQIGVNQQIFVYRKSVGSGNYKVVINPEVKVSSGKLISHDEGCLSHPGERYDVKRAKTFVLIAKDRDGKEVRIKGTNKKETIILQHEYDHLKGVTIKTKG